MILGSAMAIVFQSTLSMRRATGGGYVMTFPPLFQSTLSMRRATNGNGTLETMSQFQSTLSMRRATSASDSPRRPHPHFNPRSP